MKKDANARSSSSTSSNNSANYLLWSWGIQILWLSCRFHSFCMNLCPALSFTRDPSWACFQSNTSSISPCLDWQQQEAQFQQHRSFRVSQSKSFSAPESPQLNQALLKKLSMNLKEPLAQMEVSNSVVSLVVMSPCRIRRSRLGLKLINLSLKSQWMGSVWGCTEPSKWLARQSKDKTKHGKTISSSPRVSLR